MTIKDIARESGYAISTVSRVLNNQADVSNVARERILAVVEKHGFQLNNNAKHLKQRKTTIVAVIVKGTMNMLFAEIVEKIEEQLKNSAFTVAIHYIDESINEVLYAKQLCRERRPAGLVFLGGFPDYFTEDFGQIDLPSVLVTMDASEYGFANLSSVCLNDREASKHAMLHLLEQGHRNIGMIVGDLAVSGPAKSRLEGCEDAFLEQGLSFANVEMMAARYSYDGGYDSMGKLLENMPHLTAVFCMADVMAIGAMRALSDCGKRVPEDISVMGFDGIPLGAFCVPRLSTIKQDAKELAHDGVSILLEMLGEDAVATHKKIPHSLLEGESIAAPR